MRADQARTIDISNYLQYVEGITPDHIRVNGRELWYRSPIRDGDKTPSFKVDTKLNLWYDHGALAGGNVLDLVIELRNCTVKEALRILEDSGLYQGGMISPYHHPRKYLQSQPALDSAQPQKNLRLKKKKITLCRFCMLQN